MARQSEPSIPVLVTRAQADGVAFARDLSARFGSRVRPVVAPLIAPRYFRPALPDTGYACVAFTSAHAVKAAVGLGAALPKRAWCVGDKTAAIARAAGFAATSAGGTVDDLLAAMISRSETGPVLYLRGADTRGNLLERLKKAGVPADEAIIYAQVIQPLSAEAIELLVAPGHILVPLFSPRTAKAFLQALPTGYKSSLHFAALSHAVAEPVTGLSLSPPVIAASPDAQGILDAVETLLTQIPAP